MIFDIFDIKISVIHTSKSEKLKSKIKNIFKYLKKIQHVLRIIIKLLDNVGKYKYLMKILSFFVYFKNKIDFVNYLFIIFMLPMSL